MFLPVGKADSVFERWLSIAHGKVKPRLPQIHCGIIREQAKFDIWVSCAEIRQSWHKPELVCRQGNANRNRIRHLWPSNRVDHFGYVRKGGADRCRQSPSRRCQDNSPMRSKEKRTVEFSFESFDFLAHCSLRHAQLACSNCKTAKPCCTLKCRQEIYRGNVAAQ